MYYECTAVNMDLPYLHQLQKTSLLFVMDLACLLKGKSTAEKAFSFSSYISMGFFSEARHCNILEMSPSFTLNLQHQNKFVGMIVKKTQTNQQELQELQYYKSRNV